jgi:hypothetical protein
MPVSLHYERTGKFAPQTAYFTQGRPALPREKQLVLNQSRTTGNGARA